MDVLDALLRKRDQIKKLWLERILEEFPLETARILSRSKDPFTNPAGVLLEVGSAELVDAILDQPHIDALPDTCHRLLKLRAIQEQKPSQALGFLTRLRPVCRRLAPTGDHSEMDRRIDAALLLAVDCYLAHREHLGEVRIAELKRSSQSMFRRFQGDLGNSFEEEGVP